MSVRNGIALLLALSTLSLLVGCGSSSPTVVAPPSGGFSKSDLSGTYVFSSTGLDSSGGFLTIAGTLVANGTGGISGGTVDVVGIDVTLPTPVATAISGGSYTVGVDGRGQATLNSSVGDITLDFVLTSSSHGLVTEYDSNGSGSGTLDLQTAVPSLTQLANPYAFSLAGVDNSGVDAMATVGSFTLDTTGNSTAGVEDFNDFKIPFVQQPLSAFVSTVGAGTGPGTITLTSTFGALTFDFYPIDATHMKFIETDFTQILAGDVFTQTGASIPAGPMVFTVAGLDSSLAPMAAGGVMTSDGTGNFSGGLEDINDAGTVPGAQIPFSGTAAAGGSVGGRVLVNLSGFDPAIQYAIYPVNGGVLMLETDSLAISAGTAYGQTSTTLASAQGYGLNLSASNSGGFEEDDIAEFTTTSTGFTGIVDINDEGTLTFDKALTGSYPFAVDSTGRGGATTNYFNYYFYVVNSSTYLLLEVDPTQLGVGTFELQTTPSTPALAMSRISIMRPRTGTHPALRRRK
jgi:hypothetical protein